MDTLFARTLTLMILTAATSGSTFPTQAQIEPAANHLLGDTPQMLDLKKLTASDAAAGDRFGFAAALYGDTALVGAYQSDLPTSSVGAAYIYQRDQGGAELWGQVRRLSPTNPGGGAEFGIAVAIDADTAVVGARSAGSTGAAYVFKRHQGGAHQWGEVKKLVASDGAGGDWFGVSIAISGDTVVVGAPLHQAVGVRAGAAYVFERNLGGVENWGEARKLTASDAAESDLFGWSVAIDAGEPGNAFGAAYFFRRDAGGPENWGETRRVVAAHPSTSRAFGYSVTLDGDLAVIGAPISNQGGAGAGTAYVLSRDISGPETWGELKRLVPADLDAGDQCGLAASASGGTFLLGCWGDSDAGQASGSAYIFALQMFADGFESGDTSAWTQTVP